MAEAKPNDALIRELKQILAMAEKGTVTNAVVIATGGKIYHRTFSIPLPEDMPMMIGEVGIFQREMEMLVIGNRSAQMQQRKNFLQPG